MQKEIKDLREEVNMVDKELVAVLKKRFLVVKKMIEVKDKEKVNVEDLDREKEILSKFDNKCIKEIYGVMFKHAKNRSL